MQLWDITCCLATILLLFNNGTLGAHTHEQYYISTSGCQMVRKNTYSKEVLPFIKEKKPPLTCSPYPPLIRSNLTTIWISNSARLKRKLPFDIECCYQRFWRPDPGPLSESKADFQITMEPECHYFRFSTRIYHEFVKVSCYVAQTEVYTDYHAFVPNLGKKRTAPNTKPSVLIIGIDSLSRSNLERQMPKTVRYVRSLGAFELFGLNKIADNTFPNVLGVLTSSDEWDLRKTCWRRLKNVFDQCTFIWKHFRKHGYVTAFAEDSTFTGLFVYEKSGFQRQPTDIYALPYMVINEDQNTIGHTVDNDRVCAGSRVSTELLNEYTEKVVLQMTAKNKPFWGYFWSSTLTHDHLNAYPNLDSTYLKLFKKLTKHNVLQNTVVLFMSDHGLRFGDFRNTYQGYLEERQPFAYFLIPKWMSQKYPEAMTNLKVNQRRLTTHFDLGTTLRNLLDLDRIGKPYNIKKGKSLFYHIEEDRTCLTAAIPEHYCTCSTATSISNSTAEVEYFGKIIVNRINEMLKGYSHICSELQLKQVLSARKLNHKDGEHYQTFIVTITVKPGLGKFEASIRTDLKLLSPQVLGLISRTSRYNNNECIASKLLKLYCYCKT